MLMIPLTPRLIIPEWRFILRSTRPLIPAKDFSQEPLAPVSHQPTLTPKVHHSEPNPITHHKSHRYS